MKMRDANMTVAVRALEVRNAQLRVSATNLANESTPGYHANRVAFDEAMAVARQDRMPATVTLASTHPGHYGSPTAAARSESFSIHEDRSTPPGLDGNTVNLGKEMMALQEASLHFDAVATVLNQHYRMIRTAIGK